jgi:hypothetical protein
MATNSMRQGGKVDTAWVAGGLAIGALLLLILLDLAGLTVNVGVRVG